MNVLPADDDGKPFDDPDKFRKYLRDKPAVSDPVSAPANRTPETLTYPEI